MTYLVSDIPQRHAKELTKTFSESPESLGFREAELDITGKISGHLTLWRDGSVVTIQGEISAHIAIQCPRCLAIVMTSLKRAVTLHCFPEASTVSDMHETGEVMPEDDTYTYAGMLLDIRPMIHEQVILAVPPYTYCRQDCRGLCVVCGQDLNNAQCACSSPQPDPRFVALHKLK